MEVEKGQKWRQFLVSASANLANLSVGVCMSWSSPSTVKLQQLQPINSDQLGWITSLSSLGAFIGPFIPWMLLDRIGRKWCLLSSSVFFIISTLLLIFVQELWAIYLARLFQGVTIGIVMAVQPIYNTEISTDDYRGAVCSLMPTFMCLGSAYYSCLGALDDSVISYSTLQWILVPICILFPVTFIFMPETPHFYIGKGKREDAIKSLTFLRGLSEKGVLEEFEKIRVAVENSFENKGRFLDLFKRKVNIKALTISFVIIIFQQMMGVTAIPANAQSILLASKSIEPIIFFAGSNLLQFSTSFLALYTIEKFGRKTNLLFSSGFMALSLFVFGAYFRIQQNSKDVSNLIWLPSTCLVVYLIAYGFGLSPIPWVLVGELFVADIKALATSATVCICWMTSFIVTKLYPILNDSFGLDVVMWTYGVFSSLCSIFIAIFVFETKGLSLQEIQDKLSGTL